MQNLLDSAEIATLFLDEDLRVKRYTEEAKNLFHLIQTDIGRPLSDLSSPIEGIHPPRGLPGGVEDASCEGTRG